MDLNTKIAERRAELQREQAAEDARRRQEVLEQAQRRRAQERAIKESAEKEVKQKIQAIEAQLHGTKERASTEPAPVLDERVSQEAARKVDAHIRVLANRRFTQGENWVGGLLLFGSVLGFFMAWWIGLGMLIWACYYANTARNRHEAEIRAELARNKEGSNG